MKILTAAAMRAVDRRAIEEIGIPSLVLMENAALGVVEAIARHYPRVQSVAIFCGPGNNGGDGLAVARHLAQRGYEPRLFLAAGGRALAGDAALQLEVCRRSRIEVTALDGAAEVDAALAEARGCDLVIDALFGTGLTRPLEGLHAELVAGLNALPLPCLAIDLPSGLDASRAEPIGPHVEADLTVTFASPKIAHVFPPAAGAVGELAVADLGIPLAALGRGGGGAPPAAAERRPQGRLRPCAPGSRRAGPRRGSDPGRARRGALRRRAGDGRGAGAGRVDGRRRLDRVHDPGASR
jgi:ADP-dependent NAD(P)H-hydrate dehydratase / NAD(P)H-hydrate epimerase